MGANSNFYGFQQVIMGGITLGRPACTQGPLLGEIRGFRKSPGAYWLFENLIHFAWI
jgi:hypothetical protein